MATTSQLEEREAALAAAWARMETALKLDHRHYEVDLERARRQMDAAEGALEMAAERLDQAEKVLATAVAREEESRRRELEIKAWEERLKSAENDLQHDKDGVEERQEALLAWEEQFDTRSQQLEDREAALNESLVVRELQLERREKESQDRAATLVTHEKEMVKQHDALLERELAAAMLGSLVDASLANFQHRVEEVEATYAVRQLAIREEQVALWEIELSTRQAAIEQKESRVASVSEVARGLAAEVAACVRRETLEEAEKGREDAEAELGTLKRRVERFEELAQAWKSLKAQHLARIKKL